MNLVGWRVQCAGIVPLPSSLGDRVRLCLKKKKSIMKNKKKTSTQKQRAEEQLPGTEKMGRIRSKGTKLQLCRLKLEI